MRSLKVAALRRHDTTCKLQKSSRSMILRKKLLLRCQDRSVQDSQQQGKCKRRAVATSSVFAALCMQLGSTGSEARALELPGLLPSPAPFDQLLSPGTRDITNPGVSWAVGKRGKQLFYPDWMEGDWQFTAVFERVTFPQSQRLVSRSTPGVTKASMVMSLADVGAGMDGSVTYMQRFVASADEGGVVADRPYNIQQQVDAFLHYPAVQQVQYAPLENPTRLAVVYKTPRKDTSEVSADLRKAEIVINNRGSTFTADTTWVGWENIRQVNQAKQQGSIGDYLVAWSITQTAAETLDIRHRSAAFLQPQDPQYFDAGSRAVAIYDYKMSAAKIT